MKNEKLKEWIGEFLDSKRDQLEEQFDKLSARDQWSVARELMTYVTPRKSERVLIHGDLEVETGLQENRVILGDVLSHFEAETKGCDSVRFTTGDFTAAARDRGVFLPRASLDAYLIGEGFQRGKSSRFRVRYYSNSRTFELAKTGNQRTWRRDKQT